MLHVALFASHYVMPFDRSSVVGAIGTSVSPSVCQGTPLAQAWSVPWRSERRRS